ncbi:hypothetical protein CL630_03230 [bacterium]|nr:hypothetical protein [bacterium]|tara:strand:+ start:205 stop:1182 length:978 start_codon:yes stop_codon:yes gene_type:complete
MNGFFVSIIFIISFLLILWAGRVLPRTISGISRALHFSEFITAFLLLSFATSVPELFIGIFSAVQGIPALSLGNIMGANLVDISLVIGLSVVIAGSVKGDGKISSQNFWFVSFIAILPILLAVDGLISRGDGVLLLVIFGLYLVKIFNDKEYFHKEMNGTEHDGMRSLSHIARHMSRFLFAIAVLLGGAFAFIWSATQIVGEYFEANFILFGIVFVALGTALPELVFGIRATRQGHGNAMLGNAIGSVAFNAAAVVGVVSIIHPIAVSFSFNLILISIFLVVSFLLFHFFVYTRGRINRKEGFVLLLLYGIFLAVMFSRCLECLV